MKSKSKARSRNKERCRWQIPVLIVLVFLLLGALYIAFWLTQERTHKQTDNTLCSESGDSYMQENTDASVDADVPKQVPEDSAHWEEPDSQQVTEQPVVSKPPQNSGSTNQNSGSASERSDAPIYSPIVIPTEPPEQIVTEEKEILCEKYSMFSGQYPEDGRDELVSNVAAFLVTNYSDRFLDFATILYQIDGEKATFVVTGLPAGRSAWVMEANRMHVTNDSKLEYMGITTAFRNGVKATAKEVTITADGNMLTATNNTDQTLEGVFVYYRTIHSDGNFFGGITYLVDFGTLEPGAAVTKMGGHFGDNSEIIRIGWVENE